MSDDPDIARKGEAYRLAVIGEGGQRYSQRAIANRLGVAVSTVNRWVQEGRTAEAWVEAFDVAEKRIDLSHQYGTLIRRLMAKLEAPDLELKDEMSIVDRLLKAWAQFALLAGLNAPTRVAVGPDQPDKPSVDPAMVAEVERIRLANRMDLESLRAGGTGVLDEEESA